MIDAKRFLNLVAPPKKRNAKGGEQAFRIGTIPSSYTSGRPTVQFDGETSPSTRAYPYLQSYTPTANDRVLLARVGGGYVVLGKIT